MPFPIDAHLLQDSTFIHMMKYFLQCHGNEDIQFEAMWIFINIAAGPTEHVKIVSRKTIFFMTF